jgi:chromosome segregation ATPase
MSRPSSISPKDVAAAISAIVNRGGAATVAAIRHELGRGSLTTILALRRDLGRPSPSSVTKNPEVLQAFEKLALASHQMGRNESAKERETLELELSEIAKINDSLTAKLNTANASIAQLRAEKAGAQARAEAAEKRLADIQAEFSQSMERVQARVERLTKKNGRLTERLAKRKKRAVPPGEKKTQPQRKKPPRVKPKNRGSSRQ